MPTAATTAQRPLPTQTLAQGAAPVERIVRTMRLRDGRTLAWRTYGASDGRPLYFFHGFPSSGLLASLVHEQALAAGIALVAPDRPGFGASAFQPHRAIGDWVDDVEHLADRLGHERFGVLGVSCGGPYALACAQVLPGRLTYAGLMAGMGPMDMSGLRRGQLAPLQALFGLARIDEALASPMLRLDAWLFRTNPGKALAAIGSLLSAPDRELLAAHPELRARFCASFVDAYAQGIPGARCEARLIARLDRGMLHGIRPTVHVYQGGLDRHVPPAMGRYVASSLPAGKLHFHPGEGHLSILVNRFAECAQHFHESTRRGA